MTDSCGFLLRNDVFDPVDQDLNSPPDQRTSGPLDHRTSGPADHGAAVWGQAHGF